MSLNAQIKNDIKDAMRAKETVKRDTLRNIQASVKQIEVDESQADFVGGLAVESIVKAGEYFNLRCPLDGEYKIGGNWSETH